MKLPDIVYVIWRDALASVTAWEDIKELKEGLSEERDIMEAVGFLVYNDKRYLTICESIHYNEDGVPGKVGEVFSIPKGCILEMVTLEVSKMRKQKINAIRR